MMAAAQAAAEAALRDAERNNEVPQESAEPSEATLATLLQQEGFNPMDFAGTEQGQQLLAEAGDQDGGSMQSLLQMMAEQEQNRQQLAALAAIASRPNEHFITIAQNGTILEATETVTGFPPNTLLMTSAFESVYDEDLPGFFAVKTHFWDKGRPEIEAYIRRRTLEGDWIWLVTTAASFIDQPVPGYILRERRPPDEEHACRMNRITRIAAILVQAVEASRLESTTNEETQAAGTTEPFSEDIPWVADDAAAYRSWLQKAPGTSGTNATDNTDPLQNIMKAAASSGHESNATAPKPAEAAAATAKSQMQTDIEKASNKEAFDPLAELKALKAGTCLDMGMIRLSKVEMKMIALVLTGRLPVEDIGPLVLHALTSPGQDLGATLDMYITFKDEQDRTQNAPNGAPVHGTQPSMPLAPPAITVVNLSYTYMGNGAAETLGGILHMDNSPLTTLDVSFCGLEEKGVLALARGLTRRKRKGLPALRGLIFTGNYLTSRSARALGLALSTSLGHPKTRRKKRTQSIGYEEDTESDDDDDDGDEGDVFFSPGRTQHSFRLAKESETKTPEGSKKADGGLRLLHVGSASLTPDALWQLLYGLGADCPIRELSIQSNRFGPQGASLFVEFLEGKGITKKQTVMPFLNRLDISNNELGNDGTARLTRAIAKRSKIHLVELRLSSNDIGSGGVETILNKLLQHNLISLSLDKNNIGDQGCQLVAASLQSMHQLSRLNLSFNQIGSRGVNTLMRTLVGCESITYLGLSGNILKISGAIAMGFTLAQHPRLEELDMDNCCLSQAAQCHIVAGIISNRWVPMKRLAGFQAGPPMVALGALDVAAHGMSNEECFRLRRDEQMKTILQWMESNRAAKLQGQKVSGSGGDPQEQYLTPDFVSSVNDVHGTPSQNAYLRMLGWLSKIPFDEDELMTLRKYFYDADGGEGDRGSDGYINLKLRGDLLAALDSGVADEIRDALPLFEGDFKGSVGLDIDRLLEEEHDPAGYESSSEMQPNAALNMPDEAMDAEGGVDQQSSEPSASAEPRKDPVSTMPERSVPNFDDLGSAKKRRIHSADMLHTLHHESSSAYSHPLTSMRSGGGRSSLSSLSMAHSESERSTTSLSDRKNSNALKPRITMFPPFEQKLEELKATATEMINNEEDTAQQDVILTQYAEASLTILRQLRYHCMNSGLDGWRQGGLRRKVLIVDDSMVTRKLVSRAFEKANFIVDTAANGVEGVAKLKESIYDIAFMDIDMPVMNGFEATKALRQWEDLMRPGARQPICALTAAYVDDFERSELMKFKEAGLDVMESKPCNIPRLFKVVDDVSPMFSDLSISVTQLESGSIR